MKAVVRVVVTRGAVAGVAVGVVVGVVAGAGEGAFAGKGRNWQNARQDSVVCVGG